MTDPTSNFFAQRLQQIRLWLLTRHKKIAIQQPLSELLAESSECSLADGIDEDSETVGLNPTLVYQSDGIHALPHIGCLTWSNKKAIYRSQNQLPHWQLNGLTYFITFVLHERRQRYLQRNEIARVTEEALLFGAGREYALDAYVIMPDHVHVLLYLMEGKQVQSALGGIKRYIGRRANQILGRHGQFWQHEHFDHLVRNSTYWIKFFDYIHTNPVKARLVSSSEEYAFSSLNGLYGK
jgi:REP element-mobilizing transposase RayT